MERRDKIASFVMGKVGIFCRCCHVLQNDSKHFTIINSSARPRLARVCAGRTAEDQRADQAQHERESVSAVAARVGGNSGGGGRAVAAVSEPDGAGVARKAGSAAWLRSRRTSSSATARMKCWLWRCGPLWNRSQGSNSIFGRLPTDPKPRCSISRPVIRCIRCWRTSMARRKMQCRSNPILICPSVAELKRGKEWDFRAALTFVTTPNAPSGRGYQTAELEKLCRAQRGVVILDEAYVDFAEENALKLALKFPHVWWPELFPRRIRCASSASAILSAIRTHRGAGQNPRQLQCERSRPDRRRRDAGRSEILPRELQRNYCHARMAFARIDEARLPRVCRARPILSWRSRRCFRRKTGWRNCATGKSSCAGSMRRR